MPLNEPPMKIFCVAYTTALLTSTRLYQDIILKFVEIISDKYGIEDLKFAGFDVIFCDVMDFALP